MNKFAKVALIIAAVLAGLGILFCGISSILGLRFGTIREMARNGEFSIGGWYFDDEDYYDEDYYDWDEWSANSVVSTESSGDITSSTASFPVESVKNLKIDIGLAKLHLEESSDVSVITVTLNRGYEKYYECSMDGDTLNIKYNKKNYNGFTDRRSEIAVYIPKGMSFTDIAMDIGATEASFDVDGISCENLMINVGAGTLDADGLTVTGMTDIMIGAGAVDFDEGIYGDVKLDCGMGKLTMSGIVKGDLTARCGMGSMELDLDGRETDYNYDLSCEMGELIVNGTSYSSISGSRRVNNDGAVGTIKLDCEMGSIRVEID